MAALTERSLYSRYMLWVPDLELYLSQMPKFLILSGFLSVISSTDTISILSGGLLDLPELSQEVPEARLGNYMVLELPS